MAAVVADASVLIALSKIEQLELLEQVVGEIVIPQAVAHEVTRGMKLPPWVGTREVTRPLDQRVLEATLHAGESEAVCLALELNAGRLILDDLPARKLAKRLGLAHLLLDRIRRAGGARSVAGRRVRVSQAEPGTGPRAVQSVLR